MTPTYTPTLMEKLLGKHYKWWFLLQYTIKQKTAYIISEMLFQINQFVPIIAILIIAKNTGQGADILTYLILGNIYFALTTSPASWDIANHIRDGKISKFLIQPISYIRFLFVKSIGEMMLASIGFLIMGTVGILIFFSEIQFNLNGFLYLILFSIISFVIRFFVEILVGMSAFWITEAFGGLFLMQSSFVLFSGSLFPLVYFGFLNYFIQITPFSFTFYHPMQIYLGNYNLNQTLLVFAGGLAWCFVLYFLAKWVFKMGLKRNESVGL